MSDDGEAENLKEGKYSKAETKKIVDYVKNFVELRGIELTDVIAQMRDGGDEQIYSRYKIWKELQILMPNRTIKVTVNVLISNNHIPHFIFDYSLYRSTLLEN